MKKPLLASVLAAAVLAVLGNVAVNLAGALRQMGVFTSAVLRVEDASAADLARRAPPVPPSRVVEPAIRTEPVRAAPAPAAASVAPEPASEPADLPGPAFDPEGTLHVAAEADPNVAKLLNDTDPAVGAAVRDLVYSLAAPGAGAGFR